MIKLDSKIPSGPIEGKWTKHKGDIKVVSPANKRKLDVIVIGTGLGGGAAAASLGELGYNVKVFCISDSPRRAHSIAAFDELDLHLFHDVESLLAHRLAKLVRLAPRETGQLPREYHDLLLIDGNAVCLAQFLLHEGMIVCDRLFAVIASHESGNAGHCPRTVERVHCHKVVKAFRLERFEPPFHSA